MIGKIFKAISLARKAAPVIASALSAWRAMREAVPPPPLRVPLPVRLREHVDALQGLRHARENPEALEERARYIEGFLASCGYRVSSQYITFRGRRYRNLIAVAPGTTPTLPPLLVGAHYDGYPGTPGADDNASGMAVLLETARMLVGVKHRRSVEFVAFTLEEPQTMTHVIRRGSRFYARKARSAGREIEGAVILECVGYTAEEQKGTFLGRLIRMDLPNRGDFLSVVANRRSESFMKSFLAIAGQVVPPLPTAGYAAPAEGYLFPQLRFSDHSSFWERDYRAIMLSDTVMFRNPHYHRPSDRPDTLDYGFMARVAEAVASFAARYDLPEVTPVRR